MYSFIFYYFYKYFVRIKDGNPRFGAVCGIILTIGFQVFFILSLLKKKIGLQALPDFSSSHATNKLVYMLITLPFLIYALFYFNKTSTKVILEKYEEREDIFSVKYFLLFFLITIGPLVGTIFLLKK